MIPINHLFEMRERHGRETSQNFSDVAEKMNNWRFESSDGQKIKGHGKRVFAYMYFEFLRLRDSPKGIEWNLWDRPNGSPANHSLNLKTLLMKSISELEE